MQPNSMCMSVELVGVSSGDRNHTVIPTRKVEPLTSDRIGSLGVKRTLNKNGMNLGEVPPRGCNSGLIREGGDGATECVKVR